jgi:hypothetical protein
VGLGTSGSVELREAELLEGEWGWRPRGMGRVRIVDRDEGFLRVVRVWVDRDDVLQTHTQNIHARDEKGGRQQER